MSTTQTIGAPAVPRAGRARNVALWVLQAATAAMFLMAGFSKLTGVPETVALFDAIGIGQWFRYVTGALEVGGAVLLLVPALAGAGALLLAAVMAGAVLATLFVVGGSPLTPLVLLAVLAVIAYARRDRTRRLIAR
jgi:putative oxidoreductase